jgi:uncharacterized protein YaeQ
MKRRKMKEKNVAEIERVANLRNITFWDVTQNDLANCSQICEREVCAEMCES